MSLTRQQFLAATAAAAFGSATGKLCSALGMEEPPEASRDSDEYIVTPQHRADPRDQAKAFAEAFAVASENADRSESGFGVVELEPGQVYTVQCDNGVRNAPAGCIVPPPNTELRTRGKPTRGSGRQATIVAGSWAEERSRFHNRALLLLDGTSNVRVGWLALDGHKQSIGTAADLRRIDYSEGDNGGLHCIAFQGSRNVLLEEIEARNALADGCRIDRVDGTDQTTTSTVIRECTLRRNRRCATAIIRAGIKNGGPDQIVWDRCIFADTGDDERLPGERPGSNVDVEPNVASDNVDGLTWNQCQWLNARGSSYDRAASAPTSAGRGLMFDLREGMTLRDCRIVRGVAEGNRGHGIYMTTRGGSVERLLLAEVRVTGNGTDEILFEDHTKKGRGLLRGVVLENVEANKIRFANLIKTGHNVLVQENRETGPPVSSGGIETIKIVSDG